MTHKAVGSTEEHGASRIIMKDNKEMGNSIIDFLAGGWKKEMGNDTYWEHSQHDRNRKNCSECYKRQQAYYKLFGLNFNNPNINPLD